MNIPTAEEFINGHYNEGLQTQDFMIEFAKLHVKSALEAASEKADIKHEYYDKWENNELYEKYKHDGFQRTDEDGIPHGVDVTTVNKQSILSAYPEELIK